MTKRAPPPLDAMLWNLLLRGTSLTSPPRRGLEERSDEDLAAVLTALRAVLEPDDGEPP